MALELDEAALCRFEAGLRTQREQCGQTASPAAPSPDMEEHEHGPSAAPPVRESPPVRRGHSRRPRKLRAALLGASAIFLVLGANHFLIHSFFQTREAATPEAATPEAAPTAKNASLDLEAVVPASVAEENSTVGQADNRDVSTIAQVSSSGDKADYLTNAVQLGVDAGLLRALRGNRHKRR